MRQALCLELFSNQNTCLIPWGSSCSPSDSDTRSQKKEMVPMSPTLAPSVTHRDPKGTKFLSIVEAAYDKAKLSDGPDGEAQRINDTPGLADYIAKFFAANRTSNKYKNEQVPSNYAYPREYKGPKPIKEEIQASAQIFGLDSRRAFGFVQNLPALESFVPALALPWVGWGAFPSVDALAAKYFPEVTDPAERYCRAIQLIHLKMAETRPFHNYREGQIDKEHLRMSVRTQEAENKITLNQPGDILIMAVQLGMFHRGKSVRWARESFVPNEFGLGSLIVGSFAMVHPERFVRWEELDPDCAGDEFVPDSDDVPERSPFFVSDDDGVRFGTRRVDDTNEGYGSASGFLPPQ